MDVVSSPILSAIGLGFAYAAVPGAVNTEALRRGIRAGFRAAFQVQLGALIGDGGWAILGLSGAALLVGTDVLSLPLGLIGGAFLLNLGRHALAEALDGSRSQPVRVPSSRGSFLTGIVFSVANPAGLAFWLGLGAGTVAQIGGADRIAALSLFLSGFMLGALLWGTGMALLVSFGRQFVSARVFRAISALCGLVLAVYGGRLLWGTARRLVSLYS